MRLSLIDNDPSTLSIEDDVAPLLQDYVPEPTFEAATPVNMVFSETTPSTTSILSMPTSSSDNNNDNSNRHQTMNIGKPLHSPAVLLVLGMVATCLTIAIVIKCYRIKRRNNATLMHECRRRDIEAQRTLRLRYGQTYQHGLSSSPSSPSLLSPPPPPISSYPTLFMSENGTGVAMAGRTTLAARLRIYHEMAALNSGRFGPPPDNGIGSRMTELDDTLPQSTVAPGYYDDISPPSFQATIGNPPPYEESLQRLPT